MMIYHKLTSSLNMQTYPELLNTGIMAMMMDRTVISLKVDIKNASLMRVGFKNEIRHMPYTRHSL